MTYPSFHVGPETQTGRDPRRTWPQEEAQIVIGVAPHLARTFSTAILTFDVTGPTHVLYGFAALNLAFK